MWYWCLPSLLQGRGGLISVYQGQPANYAVGGWKVSTIANLPTTRGGEANYAGRGDQPANYAGGGGVERCLPGPTCQLHRQCTLAKKVERIRRIPSRRVAALHLMNSPLVVSSHRRVITNSTVWLTFCSFLGLPPFLSTHLWQSPWRAMGEQKQGSLSITEHEVFNEIYF